MSNSIAMIYPLSDCRRDMVSQVGGKNASLGEMIAKLNPLGVRVPEGFATTTAAYHTFLEYNNLGQKISDLLKDLNVSDLEALRCCGHNIRLLIEEGVFPPPLEAALMQAYSQLPPSRVAVRSSATAEDKADASFAGQQDTFLNVEGFDAVLNRIKTVFASLYNDRAIAYRAHMGYGNSSIALSVGVQMMVGSDDACSGVLFTLDTESGFDKVVLITGSYGLGELVVQGAVDPDEWMVYKPNIEQGRPALLSKRLGKKQLAMRYNAHTAVKTEEVSRDNRDRFCLTTEEVEDLARQALIIEKHYGCPMDIEWAKEARNGVLYIVQARPETVKSRELLQQEKIAYVRDPSTKSAVALCEGRAIGQKIGNGVVRVLSSIADMDQMQEGDVLVTDMTDPDWEPVMKKAQAIVTNRGGRTCHAAIIARELGVPAVVGTGHATEELHNNQMVTVVCSEGEVGRVFEGALPYKKQSSAVAPLKNLPVKIMLNIGDPDKALRFRQLPNHGLGLARLEFIIGTLIGIHPKACLAFSQQSLEVQQKIEERMRGYKDPRSFYVEKLMQGLATLAAAFDPDPVIVRFSDFKSNEYSHMIGGATYEPLEENPMLGFRGVARYISADFKEAFTLECEALRRVRGEMGFKNIRIMVPFVRTLSEAKAVIQLLEEQGLKRGVDGLQIFMMCEIPSNCLLAEEFLEYFDGFSIGSNDLTQLTLGCDRDSSLVASQFDERNPAVKRLLEMAIKAALRQGKYVGICGQGPSDHSDFADWLQGMGIQTISLNPDSVIETWERLSHSVCPQA
jgi:pyruvate, water dikinase